MNETGNETNRLAVAGGERQVQSARPFTSWAASQVSWKPLVQPAEGQRVELSRQLLVHKMTARHDVNFIRFAAGKRCFQPRRRFGRVNGKPGRRALPQVILRDGGPPYSLVSFVQPEKAPSYDMIRRRQDPTAVPGLQGLRRIRGIKALEYGCGSDRRRRPADGVQGALDHLVRRAIRRVDQHQTRDKFRVPDGER